MELTLQFYFRFQQKGIRKATILVFMELTLQCKNPGICPLGYLSHNPCFYGINFAIKISAVDHLRLDIATILVFMELTLQF